jgi:hypothetical protein
MSFEGFKQGLLNPTLWLSITVTLASCANLHDELMGLLAMKPIILSTLQCGLRLVGIYEPITSRIAPTVLSQSFR